MLLIDGVRYEEWIPQGPRAEDELEQMVKEHAQDIFGEDSIYLDKKQNLKSLAGVGSIPDGLVIMFGNMQEWHIVEVELSSHDPYRHIVPQVDRFLNGIDNRDTRNKIIEVLYGDEFLKAKTRQVIGPGKDVHKFLADLIARAPTITIVIEKYTSQLREALRKYTQKNVIEFQTFKRVGAEAVHAHLFEPLHGSHEGQEQIIIVGSGRGESTEDVKEDVKKVATGDFTHKGGGIFALKSNPSVIIDAKEPKRLLGEQLAKQKLWTKNLNNLHYFLRKKAGLLNTPTEK